MDQLSELSIFEYHTAVALVSATCPTGFFFLFVGCRGFLRGGEGQEHVRGRSFEYTLLPLVVECCAF